MSCVIELSEKKNQWLSALDSLLWCAYLLLLVCVSFWLDSLASEEGVVIASGVFALLTLHCVSVILGGAYNHAGLLAARFALLIIFGSLALLFLQVIVPYSTALHDALLSGSSAVGEAPRWYQPDVVWSVAPQQTAHLILAEALMVTVFLLTVSMVYTRSRVKQLLLLFLCVGLFHAVVGIAAKFSGLSFVDLQQVDGHFNVARGWFVNRNHFAAFLSLNLVGALTLLLKGRFIIQKLDLRLMLTKPLFSLRLLALLALALSIFAIVLSQSRAGFLGLIAAVLISSLFIDTKIKTRISRRRLVLPILLVSLISIMYFGSDLLARFSSDSSFLGERSLQWSLTWQVIQKEWLLGYGGNTYSIVFQFERESAGLRQVLYDQAHNDYLHIWLEQGIIGLVLWLVLVTSVLAKARHALSASSSRLVTTTMLATIIVVLAALIQSFVDFNLHIANIRFYFFVMLALPFAVPVVLQPKRESSFSI